MDLVSTEEASEIQQVLFSVNASAEVVWTTRCCLDIARLLNRNAYGAESVSRTEDFVHDSSPVCSPYYANYPFSLPRHTCRKKRNRKGMHSPDVGTVALTMEEPLDRDMSIFSFLKSVFSRELVF